MNMDFTGKVALITGGGGGIGRATALAFAKAGAKVVVVDRDAAAGEATAGIIKQQGGEAKFVAADVTKSADVANYVKETLDAQAGSTASSTMPASRARWRIPPITTRRCSSRARCQRQGRVPRPAPCAAGAVEAEIGGGGEHRLGRRPRRDPRHAGLCRLKARGHRPHQDRRRRGRAPGRAGQRGLPRPGRHADDPFAGKDAQPR